MTQKDIRDIAAYLHARCTFEVLWEKWVSFDNHNVYSLLWEVLGKEQPPQVRNVKVHLRSLSSLTDEEVRNIVEIAEEDSTIEIRRFETRIDTGPISIDWHQKEFVYLNYGDHSDDAVKNPAAIIGYLQSIGAYVPGTIDSQYVELQP